MDREYSRPAEGSGGGPGELQRLLAEQVAYYRAIAPEYDDHALVGPGAEELAAALDDFQPEGDVLELARHLQLGARSAL